MDIKCLDEWFHSEHLEFELMVKVVRDTSCKTTALFEPSCCANNMSHNTSNSKNSSKSTATTTTNTITDQYAPKLMDGECQLLYDNKECLCCCHFFISHCSKDCMNSFPNGAMYCTLTQADIDHTKCACNKHSVPAAAILP